MAGIVAAKKRVGREGGPGWGCAGSNGGKGELGSHLAVSYCRPDVMSAHLQPEFQKPLTPRDPAGMSFSP